METSTDITTSRRTFLKSLGALTLLSGCAPGISNPPSKTKGALVWLEMDQAELDAAYNQGVWAPNRAEVLKRWESNSEIVRTRIKPPKRFTYGEGPAEGLDVYVPDNHNGKIQVFIHGGAWSGGKASEYTFVVESLLKAGAIVVIPDFSPVQEVNGDLNVLADQVRRAIAFTYKRASDFGGDPSQMYLSGHSSGGHLAAVALTTQGSALGLPQDVFKGGVICSGLFDLNPVRLSARSKYIKFTDEMENSLSPQRHFEMLRAPLIVIYGTNESPEFQRQSIDFVAAAKKKGKNVKLVVAKNYNHFEILELMADKQSVLGIPMFNQMGLS